MALAHGCLNVASAAPTARLRLIFEGLQQLLSEHTPAEVAVERVFVNRNVDSALKLGQARGAALCAIPAGVPVFEYAPRAIKLAVVGSGSAEKFQVAHMIRVLLALGEHPGGCGGCAGGGHPLRPCALAGGAGRGRHRGCLAGSAMIGLAAWTHQRKVSPQLTVEVGGIGYEIEAPMSTFFHLPAVGARQLLTHLVVREDAHVLYGPGSEAERRLFRSSSSRSGRGPVIAPACFRGSASRVPACVQSRDVAHLHAHPGVGRKTAERLIVEMRDRLAAPELTPGAPNAGGASTAEAEAYAALVALGYRPTEASRLLKGAGTGTHSTEELIRRALQGAVRE